MNIKKLDDKDIVFLDQPFTAEEQKEFSEFLRKRKIKKEKKKVISIKGSDVVKIKKSA